MKTITLPRRSRTIRWCKALGAALFLILTLPLGGEEFSLKEINGLIKEGRSKEARVHLIAWLDENRDSKDYFLALKAYYLIEEDCEILKKKLIAGTSVKGEPQQVGEIVYLLGELEELTGNLKEAREAYSRSAELLRQKGYMARIHASRLFYDMGFFQEALKEISLIPDDLKNEKVIQYKLGLLGIIYMTLNKPETSKIYFRQLVLRQPAYYPLALEYYILLLERLEEKAEGQKIRDYYQTNFGYSPEMLIDTPGKPITRMETPHYLFLEKSGSGEKEPAQTPESALELTGPAITATEPTATPPVQQEKKNSGGETWVQTGSYLDRENAVYMIKDMEAKNVTGAFIHEKQIKGKTYYAVMVKVPGDMDYNTMLTRLQEQGFKGFIYKP